MRLGIFAKTFGGTDPRVVLDAAAAAGFSSAQYNMACSGLPAMPDAISLEISRRVAAAAETAGVRIDAVSGTYNMIHPDPAVRTRGLARLRVLAGARLPTRLITLCTGTRDPDDQWRAHPGNNDPDAWRDLLEAMNAAAEIAEQYDVDLGIEPELANVLNSAARAKQLIDEIGSNRLKIVLDPANLFEVATAAEQRDIVSAAIDLLADRLAMIHAKDRTADGAFTTAGRGVLDYPHYLTRLKCAGFDGALVTHGLAATEAAGVAVFLRRACRDVGIEVDA